MKSSKQLPLYFILGALLLVGLIVATVSMQNKKELLPKTPKLSYSLKPTKTELKVGERITMPIYLLEQDAAKAIAYDIKIDYDKSKLKLVSATPGGFLEKYMTVKWDLEDAWFAIAVSPTKPIPQARIDQPLLTLEFVAMAKSDSTLVSTGTTTVYVSNTGGFRPIADSKALVIR